LPTLWAGFKEAPEMSATSLLPESLGPDENVVHLSGGSPQLSAKASNSPVKPGILERLSAEFMTGKKKSTIQTL